MTDETQDQTPDEERTPDPMEQAFIAGRSRRNAQRALDAADAVEMDQTLVRAVRDGYYAPFAIVEKYGELLEEEAAEAAAEAETSGGETGQGDATVGETPAVKPLAEGEAVPEDTSAWTHPKIDAFAQEHNIKLESGLNKTDKVAAIVAALNTEE